jgi:DNA-binding NtrC family response regulator
MLKASARKLNLLVIDDDPSIVRLILAVIERHFADRFHVHGLTDSAQARTWLDGNCCDIVVSDIDMPGINGLELLRFAKQRNAWTQVIFVTGHSSWDRITEAIENGACNYLIKPIDQRELVTILAQECERVARWQTAVMETLQPGVRSSASNAVTL